MAIKFLHISFCIISFLCCFFFKEVNGQVELPKYRIDLDQPAEKRWREIGMDYRTYAPELLKILNQKIPSKVFPLVEKVALYVDTLFDEPYPGELKGFAEAFNISLADVILANIFYDLTAHCTSIVAQDEHGDIYHARNLDYQSSHVFRNISIRVDFLKNGKCAAVEITRFRACLYDRTQPGRDERWDHFDVLK